MEVLDPRILLSGHNEAPGIDIDPKADITDFYAFTSASDPRFPANQFSFVLNVNSGAQFGSAFGDDLAYEIAIDRDRDLREDIVYRTTFGPQLPDGRQTARLNQIDVASGQVTSLVNTTTDTIGNSSSFSHFLFSGLRDDPFFGSTHDVRHFAENGDAAEVTGTNESAGQNVQTIAVQVPLTDVTNGGANPVVNVFARTTDSDGNQLDRIGRPLFQPLFLTTPDLFQTYLNSDPASDQTNFISPVRDQVLSLSNNTYSDAAAQELADLLLPDVLKVDTTQPTAFPNGRRLDDDVIDAELALITNGRVTTDGVANESAVKEFFPFISDVNLPSLPNGAPTVITDPAGDATAGRPDVIQVDASSDGTNVFIDVTFTADTNIDDLIGVIGLDTDQDSATGSPFGQLVGNPAIDLGIEAAIDVSNVPGTGLALLSSAQFPQGVNIPAQIDGQKLRLVIPLTQLNNDDGNINIAGATANEFFEFDDYFPNAGNGTITVVTQENAPEIHLSYTALVGGEVVQVDLPDGTGVVDLGTVPREALLIPGDIRRTVTVTIANLGTDDLTLGEFRPSPGLNISQTVDVTRLAPGETTSFAVEILEDNQRGTFTGTVSIFNNDSDENPYDFTITAEIVGNRPPLAINDSFLVNDDATVTFGVLGNDTDPNGDELTVVSFNTEGLKGTLTDNGGGSFTYDPSGQFDDLPTGERDVDTFTYTVDDGMGGTDTATVTVMIVGVDPLNSPPVAVDDEVTFRQGASAIVNVLANDSDPDGDPIELIDAGEINDAPAGLELVNNEDGTFTIRTPVDYSGTFSFEYAIRDDHGGVDTGTVTVVVTPNQLPVTVDDEVTFRQGASATINVVANDSDPDGDPIEVFASGEINDAPAGLDLINNEDGTFTIRTPVDYSGKFSFEYAIRDDHGGVATGTVTVVVTPNQLPVAVDDEVTHRQGASATINVVANDFDPDGDPIELIDVGEINDAPAGLELINNEDGTFTIRPPVDYSGTFSFEYAIRDDHGGVATGTVTVVVSAPPVAVDDTAVTDEDSIVFIEVLANDSDPDGDTLSIASFDTSGLKGRLFQNGDNTFSYDPNGQFEDLSDIDVAAETFTYTISDGNGGTDTATVTIAVRGVTDDPQDIRVTADDAGEGQAGDGTPDTFEVTFVVDGQRVVVTVNNTDVVDMPASGIGSLAIDGSSDKDTIVLRGFGGQILEVISLSGGDNDDRVDASAADIPLRIDGGGGNDTLIGGNANDTLLGGGGGNDSIISFSGDDVVFGGEGNDTIRSGNGDDNVDGGDGNDLILGESGNDTLIGSAGNDALRGGTGNDTLMGGDGNDNVRGGAGNDLVTATSGRNFLIGGSGNDTIRGGSDNDTLFGNSGNDDIRDDAGRNLINAGDGDDTVVGGQNNDTILGGRGNDNISVPSGRNIILAGAGNDTIRGGSGRDIILGGLGNDLIDDLFGSNLLFGGPGDDEINGRRG